MDGASGEIQGAEAGLDHLLGEYDVPDFRRLPAFAAAAAPQRCPVHGQEGFGDATLMAAAPDYTEEGEEPCPSPFR